MKNVNYQLNFLLMCSQKKQNLTKIRETLLLVNQRWMKLNKYGTCQQKIK